MKTKTKRQEIDEYIQRTAEGLYELHYKPNLHISLRNSAEIVEILSFDQQSSPRKSPVQKMPITILGSSESENQSNKTSDTADFNNSLKTNITNESERKNEINEINKGITSNEQISYHLQKRKKLTSESSLRMEHVPQQLKKQMQPNQTSLMNTHHLDSSGNIIPNHPQQNEMKQSQKQKKKEKEKDETKDKTEKDEEKKKSSKKGIKNALSSFEKKSKKKDSKENKDSKKEKELKLPTEGEISVEESPQSSDIRQKSPRSRTRIISSPSIVDNNPQVEENVLYDSLMINGEDVSSESISNSNQNQIIIEQLSIKRLIRNFPQDEWFLILMCTNEKQEFVDLQEVLAVADEIDSIKNNIAVASEDESFDIVKYLLTYFYIKMNKSKVRTLEQETISFYIEVAEINEAKSVYSILELLLFVHVPITYELFEKLLYNYISFIYIDSLDDTLFDLLHQIAESITSIECPNMITPEDCILALTRLDTNHLPIKQMFGSCQFFNNEYYTIEEFVHLGFHLKYYEISNNAIHEEMDVENEKVLKMMLIYNTTYHAIDLQQIGINVDISRKFVALGGKKNALFLKKFRQNFSKYDIDQDGLLNYDEFIPIFQRIFSYSFKKGDEMVYYEFETFSDKYLNMLIDMQIKFREIEEQQETKPEANQQISDLQIFHLKTNQNCALGSSKQLDSDKLMSSQPIQPIKKSKGKETKKNCVIN